MNLFAYMLLVLLFSLPYLSHANNQDESSTATSDDAVKRLNLYKKLFKIKRKDHIAAIERIILIDDVSKTAALVDTMLKTIIKVLTPLVPSFTIFCFQNKFLWVLCSKTSCRIPNKIIVLTLNLVGF